MTDASKPRACSGCGATFVPTVKNQHGRCLECRRKANREYKAAHAAEMSAYNKKWKQDHPDRVAAHYARRISKYEPREYAPKQNSAWQKVWRAIGSGRLVKKPCERCGSENSRAHHEDYDKPLDVVWLCPACHLARHRELRGTP